ncbi:transcriptional repressor LexA [Caldanaerobius polysaccharolyticus]|uniref:transcriptional repressor LexA n=1 Tax=Caldanaerobius polysaccharolyticus TaxID=44256 RepID=UPI00047D634E|nr:transcriptional repressor LexA [Caldanaerobius polysaccharolyticus]
MEKLTSKQAKILDAIREHIAAKGYPPSVREICKAVGVRSTSTVHGYLQKLEQKGYIKRDHSKTRAIEVIGDLREKNDFITIPLVGKVTAGMPILAIENIEMNVPIPIQLIQGYTSEDKFYMLLVRGDSMINAGILDGDYIIVRQQSIAENGDIVVAMIGEEATVKRFYKEKKYIKLQPENPYMQPIITNHVNILGKVVGLFRKMK